MKLTIVIGNRPQIIKIAPVVETALANRELELRVIHTGQHYDQMLSDTFFQELNLPSPDINLGVGSGSHGIQTGNAMVRLEKELVKHRPDLLMVVGDTNSTLAGALTGVKLHIPLTHLEAGARIFDLRAPEEVNRLVTDHISSLLFTPCRLFTRNVLREAVNRARVVESGDTMYDALLQCRDSIDRSKVLDMLRIEKASYILFTMHRAENVESQNNLSEIARALLKLAPFRIVFPVHPHTEEALRTHGLLAKLQSNRYIKLIPPVGYLDMLRLISEARLVITDSGGIQKETFWLRRPCLTLRERTEWVETVRLGANFLVGSNTTKILETTRKIIETGKRVLRTPPPVYGDGHASERVVRTILDRQQWFAGSWLDYASIPWGAFFTGRGEVSNKKNK